jgi:hypothetical protein
MWEPQVAGCGCVGYISVNRNHVLYNPKKEGCIQPEKLLDFVETQNISEQNGNWIRKKSFMKY